LLASDTTPIYTLSLHDALPISDPMTENPGFPEPIEIGSRGRPRSFRPIHAARWHLDLKTHVLQVSPDHPVFQVDHTDRRLSHPSLRTGIGPLPDHDHRFTLAPQAFRLERDVGRSGHGLLAQEQERVATQDWFRDPRGPVDHVRVQAPSERVPIAPPQRVERARHDLRRAHDICRRICLAKSRIPTMAAPAAATRTAAAATSLARPIIGWCSGQA